MKGWEQMTQGEKVEALRDVLEAVLKDLHGARGLGIASTAAQRLSHIERERKNGLTGT